MLLIKLESSNLFSDATNPSVHTGRNNTASLPSLAAIVGLKYLLESPHVETLIAESKQLAGLLSVLLKYLSGWLHIDAPTSLINTKYGYVPNRAAQKLNPHTEVYSILTHILVTIEPNAAANLPMESVRIKAFYDCFMIIQVNVNLLYLDICFRNASRGEPNIDSANINEMYIE